MANPLVYTDADFAAAPDGMPDMTQLHEELSAASFSSTPVTFERVASQNGGSAIAVQVFFSGEPDATDTAAVVAVIAEHDATGPATPAPDLYSLLDETSPHDYGDVDGAIEIDLNNELVQKLTLTGTLGSGNITFATLPPGLRIVTLEVAQDGTGAHDIPSNAWPDEAKWGSKGAPTFGDLANKKRFVTMDFRGGIDVYMHYDTNVF